MFCTKCGNKLDDGTKFCTACGAPVEDSSGEDIASEVEVTEVAGTVEEASALAVEEAPLTQGAPSSAPEVEVAAFQEVDDDTDSGLEATTDFEPVETMEAVEVMEQPAAAAAVEIEQTSVEDAPAARSFPKIAVIGGVAVVVVIVVVALVMFFLSQGGGNVTVDSKNFPDAAVRDAVIAQVDVDGDGTLSAAERDAVTGLSIINDTIDFSLEGTRAKAINIGYIAQTSVGTPHTIDTALFPNLETLVVPNIGLSHLDLTQNARLQYVDVRANPLGEVDLAKNNQLNTFFCDDDVMVKGLDAAGLYFTDLLVASERDDAAVQRGYTDIAIEYDTSGRPISRKTGSSTKTFTYDDQGRIVNEGAPGDTRSTQSYGYDSNGELKEYIWSHGLRLEAGAIEEEGFTYDQQGRVSTETSKQGGLPASTGTFVYSDDTTLSPYRFTDADNGLTEEYEFDETGRLVSVERRSSDLMQTAKLVYGKSGSISDMTINGGGKVSVSFDGKGYPVASTIEDPMTGLPESEVKFACNDDGYVTDIRTNLVSDAAFVRHVSLHYVKMVSSYDKRASMRYVPRFEPMLSVMLWVHPVVVPFDKALFSTVGDSSYDPMMYGCTVYELGPEFVSLRNAGLFPSVLMNENEQKLAKWDKEHWKDGLALG